MAARLGRGRVVVVVCGDDGRERRRRSSLSVMASVFGGLGIVFWGWACAGGAPLLVAVIDGGVLVASIDGGATG